MQLLEERIRRDGKVRAGNVLKVDSFLNHQMDIELFNEIGREFYRLFGDSGVTKILTIEASGIGIACVTAQYFHVPVVFAKKNQTKNIDGGVYTTQVESFTHGRVYDIRVAKEFLRPGDRVLLKCGGVWNEELTIAGQGAPDAFIEISSYGTGDRPVIRRNGHIGDRCVRLNNPSYLRLGNLEVCNGGAGIVLFYDHSYHNRSVYLHDITAHDFGGIYRASGESSCNEEWKAYRSPDRVGFSLGICVTGNDSTPMNGERVLSDFRISDCEVYRTGGGIGLDWCDHVCCDGAIAGKNKFGDVLWERLYLHDNDIPDVSLTSLFLQCVTGAVLRDSVIDKGAGGAPWGMPSGPAAVLGRFLPGAVEKQKKIPYNNTIC